MSLLHYKQSAVRVKLRSFYTPILWNLVNMICLANRKNPGAYRLSIWAVCFTRELIVVVSKTICAQLWEIEISFPKV